MAQAIPAIAAALQAGAIKTVAFMGFKGWAAMAAMTGATVVLGEVAKSLATKPDLESMRGINFNVRDASAPRKLLYGTARTGGTIVFVETSGVDNKYLHMIIAVAGHHVNSFKKVYFGDTVVWDNGTYQTFDDGNENWSDYVDFDFRDGTQTVAIPQLVLDIPDWTDNHKLLDTAYVYCRLAYDDKAYTSGIPNISFLIEGKKIYDPRKDSTSSVYTILALVLVRTALILNRLGSSAITHLWSCWTICATLSMAWAKA